jgi:hypothetical protein
VESSLRKRGWPAKNDDVEVKNTIRSRINHRTVSSCVGKKSRKCKAEPRFS